jgi:hypothetical protein
MLLDVDLLVQPAGHDARDKMRGKRGGMGELVR